MIFTRYLASSLMLAVLLFSFSGIAPAAGSPQGGRFSFTLYGYTVMGDLTNGIITHDGNVQMQMSINQTFSTSAGTAQISGTGVWIGSTNFVTVDGSIGNVKGTVEACAVSFCQSAAFTGSGSWTGTLTWSKAAGLQGSGTFRGTLSVASANITQTTPVQVTGNWTAPFVI